MRIALVTPEFVTESLYDGGLANYVYRVARTLAFLGHEPVVVTAAAETDRQTLDGISVCRVVVQEQWDWRMPRLFKYLNVFCGKRYERAMVSLWQSAVLNQAMRMLHQECPFDIVQYAHLAGVGFFRSHSIPVVVRLSSSTRLCNEKGGYGLSRRHVRQQEWIERRALTCADKIFGPSLRITEVMAQELKRPIEVIESPFLLDVDHLDESVYEEHLCGKKYLLFFGSICHIKGVGVIAAMIHQLLSRHRELCFVFVGKTIPGQEGGSLMETIYWNAAEHSDRVIALPSLRHPQLYPIIKGAHAVVLPSRVDNFPNTCIEAMAFRRVVIGTFDNGFEQLIDDGRSGFLCRVDDPDHLLEVTERVLTLSDDERFEIGRRAALRINALAPEKVGEELVDFYRRTIYARKGREVGVS